MVYSNAISTYRDTKVRTASQGQLIIMCYDEAVKRLDKAIEILAANQDGKMHPSNIEKITNNIVKTQEIITELSVSLDFEQGGDIAKNLFSLYNWFNRELLEANISHDIHRINVVRNQISELRSAWVEIVARTSTETAGQTMSAGVNIAG